MVPGKDEAIDELHAGHATSLLRFLARLLRSEEAAADVAQEAWIRFLRFAPCHAIADPRAYLFRIATNTARDHLARERTRARHIDGRAVPDDVVCPEADAERVLLARERLRCLAKAVDGLPPRCRQVFLMSRLDGLGHAEIAARLGMSRNMVEKHIIRAMMRCRRVDDAER